MTSDDRRMRRPIGLAAAALVVLLVAAAQAPATAAGASGVGIGILSVDGSLQENVTLTAAGIYHLGVATDDASSFVNASVAYNGSLLAQDNRSGSGSAAVSLPAGNYTISLTGRGRAALAWDFTNGSQRAFPDNQTLVAFLLPSGPRLHVTVALGDAASLTLSVYDAGLLPVGNETVTASGSFDFLLPSAREDTAYLVAAVTAGNPNGLFGLSWTAAPLNPPFVLPWWLVALLWILVPVAVAALAFLILRRARIRRGMGP